MDWIKSFYSKQDQRANVDAGDVETLHRDRAKSIALPNREGPYQILELGCGGGQMTAVLARPRPLFGLHRSESDSIRNACRLPIARDECL